MRTIRGPLLEAIERNRRRLWAICYRMTGRAADADDLTQDAVAKAIERSDQCRDSDPTGWLIRLTTRLSLDHLRRARAERRASELVDPLRGPGWAFGHLSAPSPEEGAILREDLRFAIRVALQRLTPRQREALILSDVLDCPLAEVAETLSTNPNAAKALLHRARRALTALSS
jgi:RNA polymerase sigma-70 factor (ECF subfamily)